MARFRESTDRSETRLAAVALQQGVQQRIPSLQREIRRRGNGMARTCLFQYLSLVHSIQGL